jgi:hypothetical protein
MGIFVKHYLIFKQQSFPILFYGHLDLQPFHFWSLSQTMGIPKPANVNVLRGYPYLARFWSKTHTGIVRKFDDLATLNILYLQAEICNLQDDLARERQHDLESGVERRVDCDWNWFLLSSPDLNKGSKQWKVMINIRQKLDEYCMPHR